MIKNSNFLITGGTGSFGKTLLIYLLKNDINSVVCLSRDEDKQHLLKLQLNDDRVNFLLGDVRDPTTIRNALRNVDYVFHAAALKHVPASELNPVEYVRTNVIGSENLLNALINTVNSTPYSELNLANRFYFQAGIYYKF